MARPGLAPLLLTLLLSCRAEELTQTVSTDSEPLNTVEDNIIIDDYDEFSGSGDFLCDDGSGSGDEEDSEAYMLESAVYSMTTSGAAGLDIDITLQRMSDSSVQMLCKMKESEAVQEDVEGSATGREVSDNFPASIYLIRDIAVCADLSTAVGNDITTSALKLVDVLGPGEDVESLSVSWELIRQSDCMAVLKQSGAEEGSADGAVVLEARLEARLALPSPRCRASRRRMLVASPPSRVFASINLAAFALISLGVTGAFTVAASSSAVQNIINNNNNNNSHGAEQAFYSFLLTVTPVALLMGYYYVFTRRDSLRRKFDNFTRRVSDQIMAQRMDYFQDKISTLVDNVEDSLDFPMLRTFGNLYMRSLRQGPIGTMMRLGSRVLSVIRRSDDTGDSYKDRYKNKKYDKFYRDDDNYYYYEEYENIPSHRYYNGYGYDEYETQ